MSFAEQMRRAQDQQRAAASQQGQFTGSYGITSGLAGINSLAMGTGRSRADYSPGDIRAISAIDWYDPEGNKIEEPNKKEKTMFQEFKSDVKLFIRSNKNIIYSIIALYLLDHFVFEGRFKAKLLELANKFVGIVEKKVDQIGADSEK